MRYLLRRRRAGRFVAAVASTLAIGLAAFALGSASAGAWAQTEPSDLTVQITSPLGRTGLSGPMRIVARIQASADTALHLIRFYVDGEVVGDDTDGPPYAVEWTDENPFEAREIVVDVQDVAGNSARDTVTLEPLEIIDTSYVSSVLLEPSVLNEDGRPINGLTGADFQVYEDGVPQVTDMVVTDQMPATYTLLVDSSQSMSRRMEFVREAARRLPGLLREHDSVLVAPFNRELGAVTGPTQDAVTIADAIDTIVPEGGTAILDALVGIARQVSPLADRQAVVLITDGYDEHSEAEFERAVEALKATSATVYVIGIGGVAGISLDGEDLLRRLASETGGRAFFPAREEQLPHAHELIAADVQFRYLMTYTPTNQRLDGTWRTVEVTTADPTHTIRVRPGYFAPAPPPIRPQIELTIRDTNREFIDVSADELIVIEDGVEHEVEAFQEAVDPVSVALLLDGSGSMRPDAEAVMEAARTFIGALPRQDRLAVMLFADKAEFAHDLSFVREWSLEAVEDYVAAGGTALYDAMAMSFARLKREEGRRVVVVLTDGRDEDNPGTGPGSVHTYDQVLEGLRDAEATVFSIGLGPNVDREKLQALADQSAGEAYFPEDVTTLAADYRRVLENLRRRYVITYTSSNFKRDGAWRNVVIASTRPGVVVESRGGYFAPDDNR